MDTPRTVADIMTRKVAVLNEEDNLIDIREGMERFHFRHLPVVDGDRLVGIVSDRDLLRASVSALETGAGVTDEERKLESGTFVASIMTRAVITVRPDTSLADAARLLATAKVSALPVVDGEQRLVGIVTDHDFLRLAARLLDRAA